VTDSGRGVATEDLERLFDRFYRTDPSRQRADGGSGLGLAIAKSIVERHGGQIRAENTAGGGLNVSIRLPLPKV
jgi:signal transduction histidine kinase